jgi:type IV secretion system protein VirB10
LLVGEVYYVYFSSSNEGKKEDVEVVKKEETKQNFEELKEKLERVPDNIVPERTITNPLPPLPTPQVIPEIKQIKKEEEVKKKGRNQRNLLCQIYLFCRSRIFLMAMLSATYLLHFLR